MHKDKCSKCGKTESDMFWTFEDHTRLCDKCHKHYGDEWQEDIDRSKRMKVWKKAGLVIGLICLFLIILYAVYFYVLDGYSFNGYNRFGYDKNGYNKAGFNINGYDSQGFNSQGYNNMGFNRLGYGRDGYDKYGFNAYGYDRQNYDKEGYDVSDYNHSGYDRDGYNRDGYDVNGYDRVGLDKDGHHKNPTTIQKIQEIAQDYHKTHLYTLLNLFVCTDMSTDIWDLLQAQGINAEICVGDTDSSLYNKATYYAQLADMPHAWVLAETEPSSYIAVETTGGYLVWGDGKGGGEVENSLYYTGGKCFSNPKDFKSFLTLRDQYFTTCYQANTLVNYWNQNIAGKTIQTYDTSKYQGVIETKQQECNQIVSQLRALTG